MPGTDQKDVLISIRGLSKRFEGRTPVTALQDVSLDIYNGEFVSIVGPSGCGKTTLLRILAGLERKTQGEITFRAAATRDIGFVFQDPNLMPWRTAEGNAELVLELQGLDRERRRQQAVSALRMCGLEGYEHFYPKDLSGGMRHRVALARSLVHDPAVLVMDEPFSAIDVLARTQMCRELRRIWKETGKTIIYVTHDLREAIFLSERIVVMSSQPGHIEEIIGVNLPEDRAEETEDTASFTELQARVRKAIHTTKPSWRAADASGTARVPTGTRPRADSSSLRKLALWAQYAGVLLLALALWRGIVWLFAIPDYLVPPPEDVAQRYIAVARGFLWFHTWTTLSESVLGFLGGGLVGFLLGYALAKSRRTERLLMPYVVAAQMAPKLALAPLVVIWFGFGIASKAVLSTLIVFFPVLINTILGIHSIGRDERELLKAGGATRRQVFTKLEMPAILPELFAGLRTGITLAVTGAVVGEFAGAKSGLGYLTTYSAGFMDMTTVFVAILQLALLGIGLYGIVAALERILMPWRVQKD